MMFSFVLPLTAQTVASSGELAGHYYLSGVTEVGSELLLKPNGEFEWMLAYGADDLSAEGHWTVHESKLTLTSRKSSGKDSFQLTHTSAWNELAPTFLQRRMEEKAFQTLRENCPLDGIGKDDYLTIAVDKSRVPARPEAKKLLAETTQRGQDAQIALDRLKTTPNWNKDLPLIEDTNRALARYRDSQAALFALDNKQHDARVEPVHLQVPKECAISDWKSEAASFRGVFFLVFDVKRNRSVDGIEIKAHYDHGDPTRDVVLDGYAILPVIEGQTMTSITLRVPGTPKKSDQTMPVHYTGRIVQAIDADLGSMAKPAFPQMILDINADHSLSPPGHLSRGRYRKASPEAKTGSGKGGSESH